MPALANSHCGTTRQPSRVSRISYYPKPAQWAQTGPPTSHVKAARAHRWRETAGRESHAPQKRLRRSENCIDCMNPLCVRMRERVGWWAGSESNTRHKDFQSFALPTELPAHRDSDAFAMRRIFIRTDDCDAAQRLAYRLSSATRDSTKSITLPSRFALSSRSISCTPVGLVTFTSVR